LKKDTLSWEFATLQELERLFSRHLATVTHELAQEIRAKPQPAPARVSNLISPRPLAAPRRVTANDSDTWREVGSREEGLLAAIAIFRNDPIRGTTLRQINGLTAQITFYEANGGEVLRVNYGTWLGDPFNHVSLSVGDTRELLIAVDHPGAPSPFAIENTRGRAADYEHEGSREKPLARRLYDVNVRLIGGASAAGDVVEDFHFRLFWVFSG